MNIHHVLYAIFILTMLPLPLFAEDCEPALRNVLYDRTSNISSTDKTQTLNADMCSKSYDDAKSLFQNSNLADYGAFQTGDFSSKLSFENKYNQVCSSKTQAEWQRTYNYYSETLVHGNPSSDWLTCMKQQELSCWIKTYPTTYSRTSQATLYINWKDSTPARVKQKTKLSGAWRNDTKSPLLFKSGDRISKGESVYSIISYDVNNDATLELNVLDLHGDTKSCVAVFRGLPH
ncbi:MAG: hypothetical protein ACR65R_08095 [Methylomicrobium sp.]